MTQNYPSSNLTRRTFIKRSVVATVAISSMTIFSGLVNAFDVTDGSSTTAPATCTVTNGITCTQTNHPKHGNGYYCPCTKNGKIYPMGAKCSVANPTQSSDITTCTA